MNEISSEEGSKVSIRQSFRGSRRSIHTHFLRESESLLRTAKRDAEETVVSGKKQWSIVTTPFVVVPFKHKRHQGGKSQRAAVYSVCVTMVGVKTDLDLVPYSVVDAFTCHTRRLDAPIISSVLPFDFPESACRDLHVPLPTVVYSVLVLSRCHTSVPEHPFLQTVYSRHLLSSSRSLPPLPRAKTRSGSSCADRTSG